MIYIATVKVHQLKLLSWNLTTATALITTLQVLKMQWEYNKQLVEAAKTNAGKGGSAWLAEKGKKEGVIYATLHTRIRGMGGPFVIFVNLHVN